jgi:hypothetical protein
VRSLLRWILGILSVLAFWKWWTRRHGAEPPAEPGPDPAEELRRRLDEQRAAEQAATEQPAPADAGETLEERRARVHEKAQEAMDAMRTEEP